MELRAVIWDVGGVLVRTEDLKPRQALAEGLGMSRIGLEEVVFGGESGRRAQLGEISSQEHWEQVGRILGLQDHELKDFRGQFFAGDRVDAELVDAIRALRQGRYKTGILSNAFSDVRRFLTDECRIADAFDELVISAEEGVMKPEAKIYHLTLERLDVEAGQAVFIDDVPANVDGARRLGLSGILFQAPRQALQDLELLLDGRQP